MESLIFSIVSWVITGVLGIIGGVLLSKYRKTKNEMFAMKDGLVSLLRSTIIQQHDKYTERGYAPIYVKEALTKCYTAYHALGGNDVATKLYKDVMALPEEPSDNKKN